MKRIVALILALVMTMALVACGGDKPTSSASTAPSNPSEPNKPTEPTTPSDPAKPSEPAVDPDAGKYGGELIMCSNNATSTMDPHSGMGSLGNSRWMLHTFESLVTQAPDGTLYPEVCDVEQSADGLTVKITLRESYFSNGKKVTMDDVWASIQRVAGKSTTSSWDKIWKGTSIKIEGDTITFTLEKVNVNFVDSVFGGGSYYKVLPKEICDKYPVTGGELQANGLIRGGKVENNISEVADAIGSGPYKLESYSDEQVVMVRNDKYTIIESNEGAAGRAAPKKAYADKITIAINRNADSRSAAVIAGEYDMGMVTPSMMAAAQAAGYQKLDQGTTWTHGIFFNLDASNADSPIANVNVRKAIRAAIDCNAVLLALSGEEEANVLQPYPVLTTSPYHNTIISDNEWNIADKALAKEYLQKANYNGEPIVWLVPANNNMYTIAMGAIPQLEAVGIKIDLMVVDSGSHSNLCKDPKTGHDIGAWNVQKVDVNPVLHSTIVTGTNGWWSSDAKTAAIQKMQTNPTGSAASIEGYKEWCQAVVDEVPFLLFGHVINYNFVKSDLVWDVEGAVEYYWNIYRK